MVWPILFEPSTRKSYARVMALLNPSLWLRFNESSGTAVINYGSLGSAQNGVWTPGVGALGQTGFLGNVQAYDFDALDSRVTIANSAVLGNAATSTWMHLFKADGNGEGGIGHLHRFGIANTFMHVNNNSRVTVRRVAASTNAVSEALSAWTAGAWSLIFVTFDNAGDRILHVYRGQNGAVAELSYNAGQAAAVGTLTNETASLIVGNASNATTTFDGLIDETAFFSSVLSNADMARITRAVGI